MNVQGHKRIGIDWIGICLILVAVSMPFDNNYNSYSIIAFSVAALFSNRIKSKKANLKADPLAWLIPVLYFIWILLSFLRDKSGARSGSIIESNVSLLAFPLFLGSVNRVSGPSLKRAMLAFVASNIAGSVYCLYKAYQVYVAKGYYTDFLFYHHLSGHIGINAIYYSMYCLFCIIILINYFLFQKAPLWARLLAVILVVYLSLFMLLLASKMFIFLLCLSVICIVGYACIHYRRLGLGLAAITVFTIGLFFLLDKLSYTRSRIEDFQIRQYRGVEDNYNGMAVRGVLWKSALALIKDNPSLIGMGHFTAQDSLNRKYLQAGFTEGAKDNYNTHNQYLYTWLCYGYVGIFLLASYLIYFFRAAIKKRSLPGIALAVLFILANLTECMLETQKGIVFFLFFSSLICFHWPGLPSKQKSLRTAPAMTPAAAG